MKPIRKVLAAALLGAAAFFCSSVSATAETLFAGYFDIQTGSPAGTEVNGKVHLLENKNAHQTPIPAPYTLAIASDPSGVFELVNQRDSVSRLFGTLKVKAGQSVSATPTDYPLTVTLSSGASTLATANLVVRGIAQPLLNGFLSFASSHALAESELWGGANYNDATVGTMLTEIETNNGRFNGYTFYALPISSFANTGGTLGNQWVDVMKKIGGLGKAYKQSATYGPGGTPTNHTRLKLALYSAMTALLEKFPVDPATVIFNGSPIGTDYGDGFFRLNEKGVITFNDLSHQWRFTDPMTGPAVWLMPDLLADVRSGNSVATTLHEHLVRFFQLSFGNPVSYREINSPGARWGQLTDTNHTEGAFSDANLGHRFRGWVTLPAIWADYNRPITYVPYWYAGYYTSFPTALYMPGWTPHGVLDDYIFWVRHAFRDAHQFGQSGFQPDGTVSHHTDSASDAAMWAYGGEWLIEPSISYKMLKDTGIDLGSEGYQFIADRYLHAYDKMIYKKDFDFTVSGRSYYGDSKTKFTAGLPGNINALLAAKQPTTVITSEAALINWRNALSAGTQSVTGNFPFWVGNLMVHRQGGAVASTDSFYFSVKMANDRTMGAEDFEAVGKSWHSGSGILQTKVTGNEYDINVKRRWDWHALPGLTEEWRTDAIPTEGSNAAKGSNYAGMASDGSCGFAAMRYRPLTTVSPHYSAAQADKAWFFPGAEAIALGSSVGRVETGQSKNIITTVDQTRWDGSLSYSVNGGAVVTITAGTSVDQTVSLTGPTWLHQGSTGYVVFPQGAQPLYIRGGAAVVDTSPSDTSTVPIIHLAVGHGVTPATSGLTKYFYVVVPNITAAEMPGYLADLQGNLEVVSNGNNVQGICDHTLGVVQLAFHTAATVTTSSGLQVSADRPALVQLRRNGAQWELAVTDPTHNVQAGAINLTLNIPLRVGTYAYTLPGIHPRPGENVQVTDIPNGVAVSVNLPDLSDDASYDYQAALYAGAPISISVPEAPASASLKYHWKLDDGTGSLAADSTGSGLNGTVLGAAWTPGVLGGALSFDGVDDTVTMATPNLSTNTCTIAGWVKRIGTQAQYAGLVFSRSGANTCGLHFGTANELRYTWKGTGYTFNSGMVPSDGVWTFVALVISPTNARFYMDDGSGLVTVAHNSTQQVVTFGSALRLGRDPNGGPPRYFKGLLDDMRVYDAALSAEEILALSQTWRQTSYFP